MIYELNNMSRNQAQKIQKIILGDIDYSGIDYSGDLNFGNDNLKKTKTISIQTYVSVE